MFLEAQFGSSIVPITKPKLHPRLVKPETANTSSDSMKSEMNDATPGLDEDDDVADLEAEELERLHGLGIPVPGLEIQVDKHVAKIWLETLEVDCSYSVLRDRVKAVVERAVETIAPLWGRDRQ